jgi:hypothetical protein
MMALFLCKNVLLWNESMLLSTRVMYGLDRAGWAFVHFLLKRIILPRQARDKHRKTSKRTEQAGGRTGVVAAFAGSNSEVARPTVLRSMPT